MHRTFALTGRRGAKRRGNQTAKLFGARVERAVGQLSAKNELFHRILREDRIVHPRCQQLQDAQRLWAPAPATADDEVAVGSCAELVGGVSADPFIRGWFPPGDAAPADGEARRAARTHERL